MKMIELKDKVLKVGSCCDCETTYENPYTRFFFCAFTCENIDSDIIKKRVNKHCPLKDYVEETK